MASHDFQTTHWSLVQRAGLDPSLAQRDALGELIARYAGPLRAWVMARKRVDRERAEELVQAFLASRVVEKNLLGRAAQDRGRFRTFLVTALERFVIDTYREESAAKRGGGADTRDLDAAEHVSDGGLDAAAALERQWAQDVIAEAVRRMRTATAGRPDLWGVFADRILGPAFDGTDASAYADLVQRLGFAHEGQAASALQTGKRIFARTLRGVVAEYAATADEVDAELAELMAAVARR
ncbi:MAG: ECF-type sigma factor [Myxococcota bacterium]